MTETSILPGAEPSTNEGVDMAPPGTGPDETETGGDRRRILIIGAIVGAVVLAAAAYMLLHKSPSSDAPFVPRPTTGAAGVTPTQAPNPSKGDGKPKTLPKKANHPNVRDPFNPLITAPVSTDGAPASTTKVTAPTTVPSTLPSAGTTPLPQPTSPTTTTPGTGTSANGSPKWIELMNVRGRSAVFDVGYAHHSFRKFVVQAPKSNSSTGTVFDKVFALIGVQDSQATLQIGDATPFDLAEGVAHTV